MHVYGVRSQYFEESAAFPKLLKGFGNVRFFDVTLQRDMEVVLPLARAG